MRKVVVFTTLVLGSFARTAYPITNLEQFLAEVQKRHPAFEAYRIAKEAAEQRLELGDLALSPYLSAGYTYYDDKKETSSPMFFGTRTQSKSWNLGVAKQFATGTALSATLKQSTELVEGTTPEAPEAFTGQFTLGLKQNLWKDFFGKSTRIRHNREFFSKKIEDTVQVLNEKQTLIAAETAWWNFVYQSEENKISTDSLARAKKIESWAEKRAANGTGDESDYLQAKALLQSRELQQINSEDSLKAARSQLQDMVPDFNISLVAPNLSELENYRSPRALSENKNPNATPLRLDAELKRLEAKLKEHVAEEISESLKPSLAAQLAYTMNTRQSSASDALSNTFGTDHPTLAAGIELSMDLDFFGKSKALSASRNDAKSSKILADRAIYESNSSWKELLRRHNEMQKSISAVKLLTQTQIRKAKRENEKLERGRSTTFQTINFEQEAQEARSMLLKLQTELKKIEAQARMFQ